MSTRGARLCPWMLPNGRPRLGCADGLRGNNPMPNLKEVVPKRVDELLLDPQNPRFPPDLDTADRGDPLRHFEESYNLDELAESMLAEGFFAEEPLLTIPSGDGDARIVVEGNRRLATLKLLLDEGSRATVRR